MTHYQVPGPDTGGAFGLFAIGGFFSLIALYWAVVQGAVVLPVFFALFSLVWFAFGMALWRRVEAVYVEDGGMIEFVRGVGGTRIRIDTIHTLEGRYHRDYDGDPVWHLRIHHANGRITIGQFPNALEFVEQVRAKSPAVRVQGLWPMVGVPSRSCP